MYKTFYRKIKLIYAFQATLLNLLLRNYFYYNLYDQADKLVSKTTFPETAGNNQQARYMYYLGKHYMIINDLNGSIIFFFLIIKNFFQFVLRQLNYFIRPKICI